MTSLSALSQIRVTVTGARGSTGIVFDNAPTPGEFIVKAPGTNNRKYASLTGATPANAVPLTGLAASTGAGLVGYGAVSVQQKLRETVSVREYGADPTGVNSSSKAFADALAAGRRIIGTPGDTYLLSSAVVVPDGREIIGNGAAIKVGAGATAVSLPNTGCKVSGWTIAGNGGLYAVLNEGKFNEFSRNICTGNIGHFFFSRNASHVMVTGNFVNGQTADTEITTAFVCENCRHITVSNNRSLDIAVGWFTQIRGGSEHFTVSHNDIKQTQYSDTKTATASQTGFTFTLERPCFLRKVQINGKPLSTGYTITGSNPYTVTFSAGRTAGEIVKLVGYRGAENIQINGGSRFGAITSNVIDGTADSGIIALGSNITISTNTISNCGYTGIAVYGDQDGIAVTGNIITNCAQMDDGLSSPDNPQFASVFAGGILLSGSAATATGNIVRNLSGTMRYAIRINKQDMTVRTDGTPTITVSGNVLDGVYANGKVYVPNETSGQRVNSVAIDGPLIMYPKQIDLDAPWVDSPVGMVPASNDYYTVGGSAPGPVAVRDTSVKLGGVASLRTVPGQSIEFNMTASPVLYGCVVEVSFWAKNNGGSGSLVEVFTTLEGLTNPLGVLVTDMSWRLYSVSLALTPNLDKGLLIRLTANPGSSANIQYLQISGRKLI